MAVHTEIEQWHLVGILCASEVTYDVLRIHRGYTRKEPFSNLLGGLPWTPTVENWNGR